MTFPRIGARAVVALGTPHWLDDDVAIVTVRQAGPP